MSNAAIDNQVSERIHEPSATPPWHTKTPGPSRTPYPTTTPVQPWTSTPVPFTATPFPPSPTPTGAGSFTPPPFETPNETPVQTYTPAPVITIDFSSNPVIAGKSHLESQPQVDTTAHVTAIIHPASEADRVTFLSSNENMARVLEAARFVIGNNVKVHLNVNGVLPSDPQTFPVGAASIHAIVNGCSVSSTLVKVVIPSTMLRYVPQPSCTNTAWEDTTTGGTVFDTDLSSNVVITFLDQFGSVIPSFYDGHHVVFESWSSIDFGNWNPHLTNGPINVPDGNLNNGQILDKAGFGWGGELWNIPFSSQIASDWSQGTYFYQGKNTAFGIGNRTPWYIAVQSITVHGWSVTPNYQRTVSVTTDNWIPGVSVPCTVQDVIVTKKDGD